MFLLGVMHRHGNAVFPTSVEDSGQNLMFSQHASTFSIDFPDKL